MLTRSLSNHRRMNLEACRGNRVMSFSRPRHPIKHQKPFFLILCHFPLTLQLQHYNYLHALQLLLEYPYRDIYLYIIIIIYKCMIINVLHTLTITPSSISTNKSGYGAQVIVML